MPDRFPRLTSTFAAGLAAFWMGSLSATLSAAAPTGAEIYKSQCARCHGASGEGVEGHCPDPLHGERSLEDLAKVIAETMPEDRPEKCSPDAARAVAEFLYEAFYTEAARAKNKPPRVELARLTVRQYQNAAADLFSDVLGEARLGERRGLQGRYFSTRDFRGANKAIERIDPIVDFDYGEGSPDAEKIKPEEFSMSWEGGVLADDSGDYEFCVRTANGARLWVNGGEKPLIDASVQSGDDIEHRGTIRLLGGRVYPIRLQCFKYKQKTASVSLRWRPPRRAEEVIPERNLAPDWFPPTLVVETPFPPDDRSTGYERGTSISEAWDKATTDAALEIAARVTENLDGLAKCKPDAPDRIERLKEFCGRLAERAFRRPLADEERQFFIDAPFKGAPEAETAVKRSVLRVLKSPRFLYPGVEGVGSADYAVASRLSFGLWDSLPDRELLDAAAQGRLRTPDEVAARAQRMLSNPRAKAKVREFFHQWLRLKPADDITKDKDLYPGFDEAVVSDLRTSLDLFLDDVAWGEASDFRRLFLADYVYVNPRLAGFYGLAAPAGGGFERVALDSARQAGVLTHPYITAQFAYHKSTSPIHRGVFLVRNVLGRTLKPPPIAVAPLDEGYDPNMTTRERVAFQTRPAACNNCHSLINPFGFSLEHYDAVGRWRTEEKSRPIDASGGYATLSGEEVRFNGARELAEFLVRSDETREAFVEQIFHYLVKQPVGAYGPATLSELEAAFAESGYNIRVLLVEIVKRSALKGRPE